ncbi:hypothetical protein RKLH11_2136 [Rhodobacteraceae bacterium KLH11]|nr:hypothetical protein RKLH11_2136 [Rhodobacteraceae bacterium KLH11]
MLVGDTTDCWYQQSTRSRPTTDIQQPAEIDRWTTGVATKIREMRSNAAQINKAINRPQKMILWDMILQRKFIEQHRLSLLPWSHHG